MTDLHCINHPCLGFVLPSQSVNALLLVVLSSWFSAPDPASTTQPAHMTSSVVLWREGSPTLSDPRHPQDRPTAVLIGDLPPSEATFDCADTCRIVLLLDGHRLVDLRGPHRWNAATGRLTPFFRAGSQDSPPFSPDPEETRLYGYREPPLRPFTADCPAVADDLAPFLELETPDSPLLISAPDSIRWTSPVRDLRFDLELVQLGLDEPATVLERWSNLRSPELRLTVNLPPGGTFRIRLAPRDSSLVPSVERIFSVASPSDIAYFEETNAALDALTTTLAPELVAVLRARFLQSEGLWGEARRIWVALSKSHPDLPELRAHAARIARLWQAPR